jgi:hypothetical protein
MTIFLKMKKINFNITNVRHQIYTSCQSIDQLIININIRFNKLFILIDTQKYQQSSCITPCGNMIFFFFFLVMGKQDNETGTAKCKSCLTLVSSTNIIVTPH